MDRGRGDGRDGKEGRVREPAPDGPRASAKGVPPPTAETGGKARKGSERARPLPTDARDAAQERLARFFAKLPGKGRRAGGLSDEEAAASLPAVAELFPKEERREEGAEEGMPTAGSEALGARAERASVRSSDKEEPEGSRDEEAEEARARREEARILAERAVGAGALARLGSALALGADPEEVLRALTGSTEKPRAAGRRAGSTRGLPPPGLA